MVDHLFVVVEGRERDGPGESSFTASPCLLAGRIPVVGTVLFDTADAELLAADGTLEDTVLHELAHLLGFGFIWIPTLLLEDPVFAAPQLSGNVDARPRYVGSNGIEEFSVLTGVPQESIPVEDGRVNGEQIFDVTTGEGRGTVDGHWNLDDFQNELMTFQILPGEDHPLSRMTLRSMEDLGYSVDLTQADDFQLPVSSSHNTGLRKRHILNDGAIRILTSLDDL